MSQFTCISCRVAFADAELQRGHYKTDWHRYNLKRKVAELPPVTAENFQQRVLAQRAQVWKVAELEKDATSKCDICSKRFLTQNSYNNHLKSKRHKELLAKHSENAEGDTAAKNVQNEKSLSGISNRSKKDSMNMAIKSQMEAGYEGEQASGVGGATQAEGGARPRKHSGCDQHKWEDMEQEDSDAESCDSWEEDRLGLEECLFCSHISSSLESNTTHMTKHHGFFIPDAEYLVDLEGLITYLGEKVGVGHLCLWCNEKGKSFHSAKSAQQHMLDKGHCKILHDGDVVLEYADFYDYRPSYPDFVAEESLGAVGGEGEDMETEVEAVQPEEIQGDGFELVLPSGATIGHRSLMKYYRQNLPPRRYEGTKGVLPKMLAQYKALGWTGTTGDAAEKRVKDLGFMQRRKDHHHVLLGVKANKLQKHFRSQIL